MKFSFEFSRGRAVIQLAKTLSKILLHRRLLTLIS